ncbi:MAG: YsnF/AvaK domain-containing protein [Terriglobales bacterium]
MTTNNSQLAAAFFSDTGKAEKAVRALRQAGFAQIGVAAQDENKERKVAERGPAQPGVAVSPDAGSELRESMGESEYADSGDLRGTLLAAGFSEDQADHFEQQISDHGILVTVQAPEERSEEARRTLESCGGVLGPAPEARTTAAAPMPVRTAAVPSAAPAADMSGMRRIQLRGELLRVHTDRVQRGEARISKEVVTTPETVEVPVSREDLVVETHPAAAGTPASGPIAEGGEIRVPLSEEHARVEKVPVAIEEVDIGKRTSEGVEHVTEQVKREKLKLEDISRDQPGADRAA